MVPRNLLGGQYELVEEKNKGTRAISFVRKKNEDHAFIIVEWITEAGQHVAKEAHLTYKYVRTPDGRVVIENGKPKRDHKKAEIIYKDMDAVRYKELKEEGRSNEYVAKVWRLSELEKKAFEDNIVAYKKMDIDYIVVGNKNTLFGASVGESLDAVGAKKLKQTSMESQGHGLSGVSVDSLLRRGHSCVSWAIEAVKLVKPEFQEKLLSQLIVTIPQHELPDERTKCQIF